MDLGTSAASGNSKLSVLRRLVASGPGPTSPGLHPRRLVLWLLGLAIPLGTLGGVTDRAIERMLSAQVATELPGTLSTAIEGMEAWLEESERVARAAATDPAVLSASGCLARAGDGPPAGGCSPQSVEQALRPFLRAGGFIGFALTGAGGNRPVLAASGPLPATWPATPPPAASPGSSARAWFVPP